MTDDDLPPHWRAILDGRLYSNSMHSAIIAVLLQNGLATAEELGESILNEAANHEGRVAASLAATARALLDSGVPGLRVIEGGLGQYQPDSPPDTGD